MNNSNRGFKQRTMCEKQNFGRGHRGAVRLRLRNHHVHAQRYVRPRDRDRARESRVCDVKYFPAFSCSVFVSIPPSAAVDAPRGNGCMGDVATHPPGVIHSERTSTTPTTRAKVGRRERSVRKDARVSSHRWSVARGRWEGCPRRGWMVTSRWME